MIFPSCGKYSAGNTNFIFSSLINELLQMNFMIISLLLFQSTYFFYSQFRYKNINYNHLT